MDSLSGSIFHLGFILFQKTGTIFRKKYDTRNEWKNCLDDTVVVSETIIFLDGYVTLGYNIDNRMIGGWMDGSF